MSCAVFPSTYRNIQHGARITRAALFFKMYQVLFFNATHRVKAIAIAVSEVNPLGELTDCSTSVHLHLFLTNLSEFYVKDLLPYTHFYIALYSHSSDKSGYTFTRPVFLFELDHDDGTKKHILSHLNTT